MSGTIFLHHKEFADHNLYGSAPPKLQIIMKEVRAKATELGIMIPNRISVGGKTGSSDVHVSWTSNKLKNLIVDISKYHGCRVYTWNLIRIKNREKCSL